MGWRENLAQTSIGRWGEERGVFADDVLFGDAYRSIDRSIDVIDYSRLPPSAETFLGPRAHVWGDLGGDSVGSIIRTRGLGPTVAKHLVRELEERESLRNIGLRSSAWPAPTGPSAPSAPSAPDISRNAEVVLRRSLAVDVGILSGWARWHGGEAFRTLGAVLNAGTDVLPTDVAEARSRVLNGLLFAGDPPSADARAVLQKVRSTLDGRGLGILDERRWGDSRVTLEEVGDRLGITRERVRQLEGKTAADLREAIEAEPSARWLLHRIRSEVGWLAANETVQKTLADVGLNDSPTLERMLLDVAGPFVSVDGGLVVNRSSDRRSDLLSELLAAAETQGLDDDALQLVAESFDIDRATCERLVAQSSRFRRLDDRWVAWGGTVVDKAVTIMAIRSQPMTSDELVHEIAEGHSPRSLYALSSDSRVMRASRKTWALRSWGLEEYSGIAEEILERIDRDGGSSDVEQLVGELVGTFEVSEHSVRMYLATLAFVVEGNMVRRRVAADGWPIDVRLSRAARTFRRADTVIYFVTVDKDVLRGSGQAIPPGLAAALGVMPGSKTAFSFGGEAIAVGWRPWSTSGPDIGSVRSVALAANASAGDVLALRFSPGQAILDFKLIESTDWPRQSLDIILDESSPVAAVNQLADSLEVERGEVKAALRSRGDGEIADLLTASGDKSRLFNALDELIATIGS